jgi:hypothetical protein
LRSFLFYVYLSIIEQGVESQYVYRFGLEQFCSSFFSNFLVAYHVQAKNGVACLGVFQALDEAVGKLPSGVIRVSGCELVFAEALPPST